MHHRNSTPARLLMVLVVLMIVLFGLGCAQSKLESSTTATTALRPTTSPVEVATSAMTAPATAAIRTSEQAVARGEAAAGDVGAEIHTW